MGESTVPSGGSDLEWCTMADDITIRWSNLRITEEEESIVGFDAVVSEDVEPTINLAVVGKIMTVRPYNFEAFKKTMNQIWAISKEALFRSIENGLFVVQFASGKDRKKVMEGRPWTFDQHLIVLNEIEGGVQPSEIALNHSPFWVRFYNIPLDCRSANHIRAIGSSLGEVVEVDNDGILWDTFARAKIIMNITKPLKRIQRIRSSTGKVIQVEVKYERLPMFCYVCGLIGHIERDCSEAVETERGEVKQWGAWLKASPRRGSAKKQEEARRFLSCARQLRLDSMEDGGSKRVGAASGAGRNVEVIKRKDVVSHAVDDDVVLEGPISSSPHDLPAASINALHIEGTLTLSDIPNANKASGEVGTSILMPGGLEGTNFVEDVHASGHVAEPNVGLLGDGTEGTHTSAQFESLPFTIGSYVAACTKGRKGLKKAPKLHSKQVKCSEGMAKTGVGDAVGGKRKIFMDADSGMDGDDVNMEEMDVSGKKLKLISTLDGELAPLTVAEVGMYQPREGQ